MAKVQISCRFALDLQRIAGMPVRLDGSKRRRGGCARAKYIPHATSRAAWLRLSDNRVSFARRASRSIPKLLADHPARVGKIFHRLDERLWIASGRQFIMAAFACQNRPAPAHACPVERAAVILLAIAIVIVPAPARALWQVVLENSIDHFD